MSKATAPRELVASATVMSVCDMGGPEKVRFEIRRQPAGSGVSA